MRSWFTKRRPLSHTRSNDPREFMIRTNGACLDNGGQNPRAGWAFILGPSEDGQPRVVSGRLEGQGPFGEASGQTSNRAELRAVLAALRFRFWTGEGFTSVVIATDSEYVVNGTTQWVRSWIVRDWKTAKGEDVKNQDLWQLLLGEVERWQEKGLRIRFWRIPRAWNEDADNGAKMAAAKGNAPNEWAEVQGVAI